MTRFILLGILLLIIARMFWRVVDGIIAGVSGRPSARQVRQRGKLVRDPVCGTFVAEGSAHSLMSRGTTHYFCSDECRDDFSKSQGKSQKSNAS